VTWKRVLTWIAIALLALAMCLVATAVVLVRSQAFKNYLLEKIQRSASNSLGTPVRLQNLAFHFSSVSADLYGLTVRGKEPEPEPPLLTVDHIKLGVTIISLLRR